MANTMQFSDVIQKNYFYCQSTSWQRLEFAERVSSSSRLCIGARNSRRGRGRLRVSCEGARIELIEKKESQKQGVEESEKQLTCVMKFGGSSVASAERMREVAELILSFPNERPVIVLSAMGKTTNKLILAGEKAFTCGVTNISCINELSFIKDLHLRTVDELGVDRSIIAAHLDELEQLLKGIAMLKELTPRSRDYLVSFGECMSNPNGSLQMPSPSIQTMTPTPHTLPCRTKEEVSQSPKGEPVRVEVKVREGRAVNIHMFCACRPGLLLSTMRALDNLGLDIQQAVISCFNGFALDVFRAEQCKEDQDVLPKEIKSVLLETAGFHDVMT